MVFSNVQTLKFKKTVFLNIFSTTELTSGVVLVFITFIEQ